MIKPSGPLVPRKPPPLLLDALNRKPKPIRQQIHDIRARIDQLRQYSEQHYK